MTIRPGGESQGTTFIERVDTQCNGFARRPYRTTKVDMVTIRREEPDDAETIAGMHIRAWQAGYAGIMPAETLARLNVKVWAQRRRDLGTADPDHPFATLLAEDGDAIVGVTTVGPYRNNQDRDDLDHRYGEILTMYVEPARWGTGVGRELMVAALTELTGRGWDELRLWVLEENVRARRFYERAGLVADGERTVYELQQSGGQPPLGLTEIRYSARLDER